jgi:uncharacterized protein
MSTHARQLTLPLQGELVPSRPRPPERKRRMDGWANLLTGLGDVNRDKRVSATVGDRAFLQATELNEMYHGDDIIARICDRPAEEMTRQWFRLNQDLDAELGKAVMQCLDDLELQEKLADAVTWARLYGGSVMLLGVEDGGAPSEPVNIDRIQSFDWVTVLDRYDIQIAQLYGDQRKPKFGEPELYQIQANLIGGGGMPFGEYIHESRVVRFDGVRTGMRERVRNNGWCCSIIERVYPVVRDFSSAFGGMSHLLQDFSQAVFTIKGLGNMLLQDEDALVLRRLALLDMSRSVARAIPLDEGETFERKATPVAGLPELLDRMGERLSAATDMPMTILMGRSPAGMNSTGESDMRIWYDRMQGEQGRTIRRPLNRIIQYAMRAKKGPTRGREPANWSIAFNPLWQMDEGRQAELRAKQAATDHIYVTDGVVDPREIRQSRFGGDVWSPDTVLDPAFDDLDARLASTDPEEDQEQPDPAEDVDSAD